MSNCEKCGAPAGPGVVTCTFCGQAVSAEIARTAIPCAGCRTLNAWGSTKCMRCSGWLVVQCVFCGNLSPYNISACLTCNEAFAGSRERKAARDAQMQHQRTMQTVGTVGGVAAPFLGAVAGGMLGGWVGGGWGGGYHHHHNYDGGGWGGGYDGGGGGDGGWSGGNSGTEAGGGGGFFDNSGASDGGGGFDFGGGGGGGDFFGGS